MELPNAELDFFSLNVIFKPNNVFILRKDEILRRMGLEASIHRFAENARSHKHRE